VKAALHVDKFRLDLVERPVPEPGDGECLLRVEACGFCGSDKHDFATPPKRQQTPGHEFAGVVEKIVGDDHGFTAGDRVVVRPKITCGRCYQCREGDPELCENVRVYGCRGDQPPGGFAEYVKVQTRHLRRLGPGVSFAEGTMADPLAVAIHAWNFTPDIEGVPVAIFGAGVIGLLAAQVAHIRGASPVFLIDIDEEHLRLAEALGPFETLRAQEDGSHLEVLRDAHVGISVELAGGDAPTLDHAIATTLKGGTVLLVSQRPGGSFIDYQHVMFSQLRLQGVSGQTEASFGEALELMDSGKVRVAPVITAGFPLDRIQEGLEKALEPGVLKVYVAPGKGEES
jgi:threonine dehydrogenase-like Zn-dependent dehydrogenase